MAMSRIGRRRLECYELIKKLQSCPGIGATMQYELAMSAVTSAQLVGDRFLEAEAMMLFAHRLAPTYCPKETLEFLKKAESIFLVHKNLHKCMSARALVAFTLCELGEESNAITLAQEILLQGVSLRPDDACIACLAMATAYTKLGDLGRADKFINEAVKYSRAPNASRSSLLTGRIAWVRLQILWEKYIITEHPRLWRGVPFFLSVPEMDSSPPDRNTLAGQISAAREVQPDAKHWNSAQVMELALYGLTGGVEDSGRAVAKLEDLSARLWSLDRPVAVSALLYGAMLFADHGKAGPALEILKRTQALAAEFKYETVLRESIQFTSQIREQIGDSVGALNALKLLKHGRIRSLMVDRPMFRNFSDFMPKSSLDNPENYNVTARRNFEPVYVKRALDFIEKNIRSPLPVKCIVEHCKVSRRTLEMGFRECLSCSIAEHVRIMKLQAAASELLQTTYTIRDVSKSFGFSSAAKFSRDFLAYYGVTPSIWVRQQSKLTAAK
ncbi:AraC family transcriptional regulator [Burkholderia glumae]|uniref:Helix-turn-helix transcriptional regulator n=2 Tax=Burkholderia glumae TaxID=337 RepID=A0AAQ0BPR3_BURGL|nr:Transcriptional regulator, AraC family [Burkholderia glumae BGR1]AJY63256.1 helix-turn-helix domain protein [Burkholderia glumae LMG 2196 = ATCC 33617]KHJ61735.1 AraC family transcriptional regulator [Burkholderia glumae]MCR1770368.1 helix-turn-helix transcriptional regulator [Burkholderia glumae]NVE25459.1 helix-turn-helix transcriptional regulator [Burkholderia glumae]